MQPSRILAAGTLFGLSFFLISCKSEPTSAPITQAAPATDVAPEPPPLKPALDGKYSSIEVIPGEGDILGQEVTVAVSQTPSTVTFVCAEGERSQPQRVPASLSETTLHFKTADSSQCPAATYTAQIIDDTMSLSNDGVPTAKPEILRRVKNP
jgi:hypothetical protein